MDGWCCWRALLEAEKGLGAVREEEELLDAAAAGCCCGSSAMGEEQVLTACCCHWSRGQEEGELPWRPGGSWALEMDGEELRGPCCGAAAR